MQPLPVPESAKRANPDHVVVSMAPPPGVSDDDCGTAEMLLGRTPSVPTFAGRDQLAYFRPTEAELKLLNEGGHLELNQLGQVVQPFALNVLPGEPDCSTRPVCECTWSEPVDTCPDCGTGV